MIRTSPPRFRADVAAASKTGRPIVALESTIVAHGLPRPDNLAVARQIEQTVRDHGAVPATIGMIDGQLVVGLDDDELTRMATAEGVAKLSVRDLALAAAAGADGATTVASTSAVAAAAGIAVFATGGLGGVHRDASLTYDESADLTTLGHTPIAVVCAGVKSILDVPATLEYLETLSVPVIGYRTDAFPGFYLSDSGEPVTWRVDTPEQAAAIVLARRELATDRAGVVLANPLPPDRQLDPDLHDATLATGLALVRAEGVTGKDVTPRLLAHFHDATHGESLRVNVELVLANAALAGQVAAALAAGRAAAEFGAPIGLRG